MSDAYFDPAAREARAKRIPAWRWAVWYACLGIAMVIFYVLLTPLWLGLRGAAWIAEFKARRRRPAAQA
jgi:hypothetical protein